ncbi:Hsp20/alpha crystallin family protein [Flavobacterium sp. J49]|uniref:Hsp20/alpha crystallin family protein n=1 Tax=Flavobacterium sp. J49 TaxID=2718534 RepID=UPI001592DAA0|nr:Hsp20/alpha crystallin family protein [Flavobacterium sp. J49]MBF6641129.1 Hsp20/alpha crystallin family protein [Flavobacterium sp. J49]NIC02376.1 Hsp20/alpha crystallin family protein [Flavobacterium sp. J49]
MNLVKRNYNNFPSIIDEFLKPDWFGGFQNLQTNSPAVNIKETDANYSLELAAPGKVKEDFVIEIDHNVLTISSEVKAESEQKDEAGRYTRREFSYAAFRRAFTLPETVNTDDINANYENGVLYVTLPKKQEALPKPKRLIDIL